MRPASSQSASRSSGVTGASSAAAMSESRTTDMAAADDAPVTPELREALWEDAGLIRNAAALSRVASSPHLLASLVARSALAREESRGGHFREDFPHEDPALVQKHTVLAPGVGTR